ncbi:splicing factor, arginine/serine-rich 19 [Dromaius novaehollandiae]|uniref:splicing factor, arginine/serine-rich 19 n=1 Tax=Dromaius novaehollandiae TaxID=8790 RepID=UPI00311E1230
MEEEEEKPRPPGREEAAGPGEEPGGPGEAPAEAEGCQRGPLCPAQVLVKALQRAVSGGFPGERRDWAGDKAAAARKRMAMARQPRCWGPRAEGGPVSEAPGGLAGALDQLQQTCLASLRAQLLLGSAAAAAGGEGDGDLEEVELVAEVRVGDVAAASGLLRRERPWRAPKGGRVPGSSARRWRAPGGPPAPPGGPPGAPPAPPLPPPRRPRRGPPPTPGRPRRPRGPRAAVLGAGPPPGQQRPQGPPAAGSREEPRAPPPPASALEKADSSSSSSSSSSSRSSSSSSSSSSAASQPGAPPACLPRSPALDIYDPFHPTDEDGGGGDAAYGASPPKEPPGRQDQKYDPFDPTGSNPSSSRSSPSPDEDDDEEEEDEEEEEEDDDDAAAAAAAARPDMSHSISRISETLAGIYDDNSLSQDFPGSEKGPEEAEPGPGPAARPPRPDKAPAEPSAAKEPPPGADSTLPEEENGSEQSDGAEPQPQPRRRVFVVDLAAKSRSEAEANPQLEGKVSLEVVTAGNAKAPRDKGPRGGRRRGGRRAPPAWAGAEGDSEIEEGEIVQPEDERYSPIRLFRSRCRAAEPRALPRLPEGDDFLSLHAESDEEAALQADFGDSQPDPRWKGTDLRRKILTQRRERFRPPSQPRSASSSGSRKKSKRSRERKEPRAPAWPAKKASESRSKSKERRRSRSRHRGSRSRSRRRSWSPAGGGGVSVSAVGSDRRRRRSKSREKRRGRRSRSGSSGGDRARRPRHKEKHRGEGKKKKKQRSRSREKRPARRASRDKEREAHALEEAKAEKAAAAAGGERRRDARAVVPPSIQELNDADLFTIKRTITVSRQQGTPEPAKREVLYDSEGLSFEGFSDREPPEPPAPPRGHAAAGKGEAGAARKAEEPAKGKAGKEKERKRGYAEERPAARDKYKKKFKEGPGRPAPEAAKAEKEKPRAERDKAPRKAKAGHKEGGKGGAARKVKLQSKVAVLIREGVSSTTASVKEAGSIGVKFSRDTESRSPFLKAEEKAAAAAEAKAGGKAEPADGKEPGGKAKKAKTVKAKTGLKKAKGAGGKAKGAGEAKKKKKTKPKGSLKKSKADSCSQGAGSPPPRPPAKDEAPWAGPEKAAGGAKPPSPAKPPAPPAEQELTPDSQTVDSSCKTPDVSFLAEEEGGGGGAVTAAAGAGGAAEAAAGEPQADSRSEAKEEPGRPLPPPPPPAAPLAWNLPGGVDCTTSGVLALTALLFKMEEANLASRAKAQELIQATNQILSHAKPPAAPGAPPPPAPAAPAPAPPAPPPFLLHGALPLGGGPPVPPGPPALPGLGGPAVAAAVAPGGGPGPLYGAASEGGKRDGSVSSEGRGDTDKYLKKLHTQERAVEEVKLAIKPYYQKKEITKDEYKDILRKAVHKICHSRSGEINPVKVTNLVTAYVQRYKYFRKRGRRPEEEPGPGGPPKELGGPLDKAPLPMPPL